MEFPEHKSEAQRMHSPTAKVTTIETAAAAAPDASPNVGTTPEFYWQLTHQDRARLDHLIDEEEGYLAHDINWGRLMLDQRLRYKSVPDVSPHWAPPQTPEHFSDAISAILQVAIDSGLDPEAVCDAAINTCYSARHHAITSIRRN